MIKNLLILVLALPLVRWLVGSGPTAIVGGYVSGWPPGRLLPTAEGTQRGTVDGMDDWGDALVERRLGR